jgi:titin
VAARFFSAAVTLLALFLPAGCYVFDNPADPEGTDYQGFPTSATVPESPSNLTRWGFALDGDTRVRLTWVDNAEYETGFRIEIKIGAAGVYGEASGSPAPEAPGTGATVAVDISGLTAETGYFFRVCAVGTAGRSAYSNEVAATTGPGAPTALGLTPAAGKVDLGWTDNSSAETGFIVQRSLNGSTYTSIAVLAADTTSWQNTGLSSGSSYYYRVYATGPTSNSAAAVAGPVAVP